jgi:hypothetical protein
VRDGSRRFPVPRITPEKIEQWTGQGVPRVRMAAILGIHLNTLSRKIRESEELKQAENKGREKFNE